MPEGGLFATLQTQPLDPVLGLGALHAIDPRPHKVDLGIGVYRDESGATPVLRSVKEAERRLVEEQPSKSYIGPEGDGEFCALIARLALGTELAGSERVFGIQAVGGAGALRLGAELIARARPTTRIWVGEPTWSNHLPTIREAGLPVGRFRFYDPASCKVDFQGMIDDLRQAEPGDGLLLQGCCHNPTGARLSADQWQAITALCRTRRLTPLIDLAYQGLGEGLDEDAQASRDLLTAVPDGLLAYSCDKNFSLYRERVGALFVKCSTSASTQLARENAIALARMLWSMPPDHGAAVVRSILADPAMREAWTAELDVMRSRINAMRATLAAADPSLAFIGEQRGMFALLPLGAATVQRLREGEAIYLPETGRINLAGLNGGNVGRVATALSRAMAGPAGT